MSEVLRDLDRRGYLVAADTVAALSPYPTAHLKRFGDYVVDVDTPPKPLDPNLPPHVVRSNVVRSRALPSGSQSSPPLTVEEIQR
jgi:hypothetical protein